MSEGDGEPEERRAGEEPEAQATDRCSRRGGRCSPWWRKRALEHFGSKHLIASTKVENKDYTWVEKCLPQVSMSSILMFFLSPYWAFIAWNRGGFKDDMPTAAAKSWLSKMSQLACVSGTSHVRLCFDPAWMPRWPRPLPIDSSVIDLPVEDGHVQLQP